MAVVKFEFQADLVGIVAVLTKVRAGMGEGPGTIPSLDGRLDLVIRWKPDFSLQLCNHPGIGGLKVGFL